MVCSWGVLQKLEGNLLEEEMFNRLFLYSMDCVGVCWFVLDSMDCWRSCLDCWIVGGGIVGG